MTTPGPGTANDAVNRALAEMNEVLDEVVDRPTWAMTPDQQRQALVAMARVESRMNALRLAVISQAECDAVGVEAGATSTAAWHADATGQTPAQAFRLARQAKKLDGHDAVRAALAAGEIRLDQAEVITDAVDALPSDLVDQQIRDDARDALLGYATAEHALNARELRRVGQRILPSLRRWPTRCCAGSWRRRRRGRRRRPG